MMPRVPSAVAEGLLFTLIAFGPLAFGCVEPWSRDQATVLVAGSLRAEPGDVPKGGLWVVEAPTKAAVLELMQSDPFYICGLRQGAEVLHWSKALERQVLV